MMGHPRVELPSMADYGVGPSWEGLPWRWAAERLTGALLDRLTHHVSILEMNGDSYRLAQSRARKSPQAE